MMTLSRAGGKIAKSMGWWNLLVLGGVWAWFSTPVDAQQKPITQSGNKLKAMQSNETKVARGFDREVEDDSFSQPGFLGRSAMPSNRRDDQFENRPARRESENDRGMQFERIDLRPNRNPDARYAPQSRIPSNDDSRFSNPRQHRANRAPSFLDPELQSPGNASHNRTNPRFQHDEQPEFNEESSGYRSRSFQNPRLQNPTPRVTPQESSANPIQEIQAKITRRYQNQGFLSLLNLQPQEAVALYREVGRMIDERHLEPTPVEIRVQRGMTNLMYALDNPAFVQGNQLSLQPANVQAFRAGLQQALQSPVQSEQDAVNAINWTMQMAQQQIGLRPAATAMEFVYGAVESLDKYSAFIPPERTSGASLQLETSMVGIGVQIEMRDEGAEVMKVISGSPAQSSGMQKGDLILAVSGHQLGGMSVDQTVNLITGTPGSPVVLGIQRRNQGPFTMTVTRQAIQLHSVNDIQMLDGSNVGYFKLDKFTASANDEIEKALLQLHQQGMQSLVIDLRGNPGGLLTSAIQISDKFLPEGTIVATRGRNSTDNTEEHATREHTWKVPLVVLVDHNSASASEIFAAAIQENGRGVVVGRTSYGKGTVQTQFPLQTAGCSLRITTAKFYSPNGRVMAGSGVTPDVPVAEETNGNEMTVGVLDRDVQAALNVAQQGGFSNPNGVNGVPNRNPGLNQNLSSSRGFSQPQPPQPFAQPRLPANY